MNRDELTDVFWKVAAPLMPRSTTEAIEAGIDAIDSIIRADERERHPGIFGVISGSCGHTWLARDAGADWCPICADVGYKVRALLTDLRAKVEALHIYYAGGDARLLYMDDVLALLDEEEK
jgi:hypothetical protein